MIGKYPGGIDPGLIHLTGTIVTWWGRIEGLLVYELISLRQHPASKAYAAKNRFPVAVGAMIKQWADMRRAIFADKPHKLKAMEKLKVELEECSQDRHTIVHYFWPYGSDGDGSSLNLQSIKTKKGTHDTLEFRTITIDVSTMDKLNEQLASLYTRMMVSGMQLLVGPDRIQEPPTIGKVVQATKNDLDDPQNPPTDRAD